VTVHTLVECRSFRLEREDHDAALEAVRALAREAPTEVSLADAVAAATDVRSALNAAGWNTRVDQHGDIVELSPMGDTVPTDSDCWPEALLRRLAPYARFGEFRQTHEGWPDITTYQYRGGRLHHRECEHGIELIQVGQPPLCAPGDTVQVEFQIRTRRAEPVPVRVDGAYFTQVSAAVQTPTVTAGDRGAVAVTVAPGAADPAGLYLSVGVDGEYCDNDSCSEAEIRVAVRQPAGERDGVHEVVAADSPLDHGNPPSLPIPTGAFDVAVRALRRYASRHRDRPGAGFLRAVAAAPDLIGALRVAGLEPEISDRGLHGVRFTAPRLPGYERYLAGLFWSLRDFGPGGALWFGLAYAHAPDRWVRVGFNVAEPERTLADRTP